MNTASGYVGTIDYLIINQNILKRDRMKRLLMMIVMVVGVFVLMTTQGCKNESESHVDVDVEIDVTYNLGGKYYVNRVQLNDCVYMVFNAPNRGGITHAGDCPNPTHITEGFHVHAGGNNEFSNLNDY